VIDYDFLNYLPQKRFLFCDWCFREGLLEVFEELLQSVRQDADPRRYRSARFPFG